VELLELPFEPASASVARRHVVHLLRMRGLEQSTCEDAALVVSELVGNAVRHGRAMLPGTLGVGWQFTDDGLRVEVTDGGSGVRPTVQTSTGTLEVSGRGLGIIAAVADVWGYESDVSGTTVWALLGTSRAAGSLGPMLGLDPEEYGQTG
jgi:serine/threonine-protein kinase RsbW